MKLSARNQIPARVTGINNGEAIANVELDAGGTRLVASITVDQGPSMKRFMPRAMGRASKITKKTSHVSVVLDNPPARRK